MDSLSSKIHQMLETTFYQIGLGIANRPKTTLLLTLLAVIATTPGFLVFRSVAIDDVNAWMPRDHLYSRIDRWVDENFNDGGVRYETFILAKPDGNVLTADNFRHLYRLEKTLRTMNVSGVSLGDVCARPGEFINSDAFKRRRRRRRKRSISATNTSEIVSSRRVQSSNRTNSGVLEENQATTQVAISNEDTSGLLPNTGSTGVTSGPQGPSARLPSFLDLFDEDELLDYSNYDGSDPASEELYDITDVIEAFENDAFDDDVLQDHCIIASILQLWPESETFSNITDEEILRKMDDAYHKRVKVPSSVHDINLVVSDFRFDDRGHVAGAEAIVVSYLLRDRSTLLPGESFKRDSTAEVWEKAFLEAVKGAEIEFRGTGVSLSRFTARSFADGTDEIMGRNMVILCAGFALIFVFLCLTMGPFNLLEARIHLAVATMLLLGLAIYSTYGFSMLLPIDVSLLHSMVPFLLLGIGVDDAFVILQSLDNVRKKSPPTSPSSLNLFIARGLAQAGVSISVTSVTDVLAFAVGAAVKIPVMRSFCIYCSIGIFFVYLLTLGFFLPLVILDERRKLARRDALLMLKLPSRYEPSALVSFKPSERIFERIGLLLSTTIGKVLVILVCTIFLCVNCFGAAAIDHNFDRYWYLSSDSYQLHYMADLSRFFPKSSFKSAIFIGNIDYHKERLRLEVLGENLKALPSVQDESVQFWYASFLDWIEKNNGTYPSTEAKFTEKLRSFLLSTADGRLYLNDIRLNGSIFGNFHIRASRVRFSHVELENGTQKYKALDDLTLLSQSLMFTTGDGFIGYFSQEYLAWSANKEIMSALPYSLGFTLLGSLGVISLMLGDFQVAFLTLICVLLTLIDVIGALYFWGLTLEHLTALLLIISIGLSIDYSAHIGHTFLRTPGKDGNERLQLTLKKIGPAILKGALSSFLAFVLCSQATSYVFKIWFQVITSVVFYGLLHGCILMPVLVSLLNPQVLEAPENEKDPPSPESSVQFGHVKDQKLSQVLADSLASDSATYGMLHTVTSKVDLPVSTSRDSIASSRVTVLADPD